MKKSLLYIALLMSGAFGFTSCEGDLERPPMIEPEATIEANTTIAELKAMVWQTDRNYVTEVGKTGTQNIIIAGRVVSNDKAGNVFKNVVLQDNSGAITVAINAYDLYETYQQGQQIVVDMTGLKVGGYNGLLQVGDEGTYNGAPSMTFMTPELFAEHAQQNGLARLERIDTLLTTIPELTTAKGSVEGLQKWQSQFIRLDNVAFEDAGQPFAGSSTADRYVKDENGNRINVRNSSYADFANAILPSGKGSIAGILSYYGTDWQIILNDINGCIGYGEIEDPDKPDVPEPGPDTPTLGDGDGSLEAPYNVAQVLAGTTGTAVWSQGYIIGSVTDMSYTSAVVGVENASTTNILIADSPSETDFSKCVPVQLPDNAVRPALNLQANPGNLGKLVKVQGNLEKYFGVAGIKVVTAFEIEGGSSVTPPAGNTIFSSLTPSDASLAGGWTIETVKDGGLENVWTWKVYNGAGYLNGSGYSNGAALETEAYAISPVIDLTTVSSATLSFDHAAKFQTTLKTLCGVVVRQEGTSTWTQLSIPTWPAPDAWTFVSCGAIDLKAFAGKKIQVAFKYGSSSQGADTWEIKNLTIVGE